MFNLRSGGTFIAEARVLREAETMIEVARATGPHDTETLLKIISEYDPDSPVVNLGLGCDDEAEGFGYTMSFG